MKKTIIKTYQIWTTIKKHQTKMTIQKWGKGSGGYIFGFVGLGGWVVRLSAHSLVLQQSGESCLQREVHTEAKLFPHGSL